MPFAARLSAMPGIAAKTAIRPLFQGYDWPPR